MNPFTLGNTTPETYNNTITHRQHIVLNPPQDFRPNHFQHYPVNLFGSVPPNNESPVQLPFPPVAVHPFPSVIYPPGVLHPTIIHVNSNGSPRVYPPIVHTSYPGANMPPFCGSAFANAPPTPLPPPPQSYAYPQFGNLYSPHGAKIESHPPPLLAQSHRDSGRSSEVSISSTASSTSLSHEHALNRKDSIFSSTTESALITPPAYDHLKCSAVPLTHIEALESPTMHSSGFPQSVKNASLQVDVGAANQKFWRDATPNKNFQLPTSPPVEGSTCRNGKHEQIHNAVPFTSNSNTSNHTRSSFTGMLPPSTASASLNVNSQVKSLQNHTIGPFPKNKLPEILSPVNPMYSDLPPGLQVSRMMAPLQHNFNTHSLPPPKANLQPLSYNFKSFGNSCQIDVDAAAKVHCHPEECKPRKSDDDIMKATATRVRRHSSRGASCKRSWLDQNKVYQDKLHARGFRVLEGINGSKVCSVCHQHFAKEMFVWRHALQHIAQKPFHCNVCGQRFTRSDTLQRHIRRSGHFTETLD